MIKTKNQTTTVLFGKGGKGNISVGSKKGLLILQMLTTDKKIFDKLSPEDIQDLPKIELNFFDPKSIDVLIAHLDWIKRSITPPPPPTCDQLALAC